MSHESPDTEAIQSTPKIQRSQPGKPKAKTAETRSEPGNQLTTEQPLTPYHQASKRRSEAHPHTTHPRFRCLGRCFMI
jgi:hypothetical protein